MRSLDLSVDVQLPRHPDTPLRIAATAWLPDTVPDRPLVVFALPGGGYSRGYYDVRLAGREGYSQAEHHTARGAILVGIDHLGVGDSSPDLNKIATMEDLAEAADSAVRDIVSRLRGGTLSPGVPALEPGLVVGIGQSMGGGVTTFMEGRHRTYDAISMLGYSGIHTLLPMKDPELVELTKQIFATLSRATPPEQLDIPGSSEQIPDFLYPFHWEDVPREVVEADIEGGYPLRTDPPPWGSATMPNCTVAMMAPGFVAEEAAVVDVPVFLGFGERDTSQDPHAEPGAFPLSSDVTVFVVPKTAHMHNLGSGREMLWNRLLGWAQSLAA